MVNGPAVPIAIVGAGPYGLSVGAHLRMRGLEFRLFGTPMASWLQHMPAQMFLKSVGFASNLSEPTGHHTLRQFCVDHSLRYEDDDVWSVPLSIFAAYGLWFQRRLLPDAEQDTVVALSRHDESFRLDLASGESLVTRSVVLAVGSTYFAYTPPVFDGLPPELVSHTSRHRDFSGFSGRDVTVIGAGQSALESAALLHEAGANVRVVARRQVVWNSEPPRGRRPGPMRVVRPTAGLGPGWKNLFYSNGAGLFHHLPSGPRMAIVGRALGPAGAWWLRERVLGKVPLLTGQLLRGVEPHGSRISLRVEQPDGRVRHIVTDHVVAGTGYRVDLAALRFLREPLLSALCQRGRVPSLTRNFESVVPNLYLTGLVAAPSFGPSMRFVFGADFAARRLVKRLATDPRPYGNGARHGVAKLTDGPT